MNKLIFSILSLVSTSKMTYGFSNPDNAHDFMLLINKDLEQANAILKYLAQEVAVVRLNREQVAQYLESELERYKYVKQSCEEMKANLKSVLLQRKKFIAQCNAR